MHKTETGSTVIVGSNGGIGGALESQLAARVPVQPIYAFARTAAGVMGTVVSHMTMDPLDEASIRSGAAAVPGPVSRLIITTGMLHDGQQSPEKSWRDLDAARLMRSFAVNTVAPMIVAKHFIPLLPRRERAVIAFLSARVGSISDNRTGGWHGYRASKAALNMMVKNLGIELARSHPEAIVVALHPGTVDTAMSKPFQAGVAPGKLFTPAVAAAHLLRVIDTLTPDDSGGHFAWDGTAVLP
jgi:NAD(P)-dependent dehydrogenase (short-subunit alcohol dehydrogenase family)